MTSLDEVWRKSTKSGPLTDNCVEVRRAGDVVQVRDTKDQGQGPVMSFTEAEWIAFVQGVQDGEFDL